MSGQRTARLAGDSASVTWVSISLLGEVRGQTHVISIRRIASRASGQWIPVQETLTML